MRTILSVLFFIFSLAFADGQTNTIKVKKNDVQTICDCKETIAIDLKGEKIAAGDTLKKNGILKGKVYDNSTEKPVSNAVVELLWNGKIVSASCSDSLGNYTTRTLPPNKYIIRVKKCGYKTRNVNSVEVRLVRAATQDINLAPTMIKKAP